MLYKICGFTQFILHGCKITWPQQCNENCSLTNPIKEFELNMLACNSLDSIPKPTPHLLKCNSSFMVTVDAGDSNTCNEFSLG